MPKGTDVERCVEKLKKAGYSEERAIRTCQKSTGHSLKTGKPPKRDE